MQNAWYFLTTQSSTNIKRKVTSRTLTTLTNDQIFKDKKERKKWKCEKQSDPLKILHDLYETEI